MDHLNSLNLNAYAPRNAADLRLSTGSPEPGFAKLATLSIWTGAATLQTYPDARTLRELAAGATAAADALEPRERLPDPVNVLREVRRWIGDGDLSDGLHREHWTPEYAAIVDLVDAALAKHGAAL